MQKTINRHGNILDYALSSLLRRKAKNLSLLFVYTLIVFVIASLIFFVQALKKEAAAILQNAPDLVVQRTIAGRHDLIPVAYAQEIAGIRGVRNVTPRFWGYYFDPVFGANYTIMADPEEKLETGSIMVGPGVAANQRISEGDLLTLKSASGQPLLLNVGGIYPPSSELVSSDLILMSKADFQEMFGIPSGLATDLAVNIARPEEQVTIATKIAEKYPSSRPILKKEILRTYDSIFDWRSGMMVVVLFAAILSFVIFAWDKAAGLSAEERKEIGILKSIGWETGDVLLLKFWEGQVVSLTAFLTGVLLAYLHVFFFSASIFEHALKGWAVIYPQFRLEPHIDPYQLAILFFLTVLPYTAATIIPSWLAATLPPDSAMRS
jgi:ABC-type lipoprotein release transport system permease subunit